MSSSKMSKPRMEPNPRDGFYSMGPHTHSVAMELFALNRKRLVAALKEENGLPEGAVVLIQGGGDQGICEGDSSDVGPVFKQEAFFHWAFGILEPDCYGTIDVASGKATIFIPRLPEEYAVWMGSVPTCEETKERYQVDEVRYTEELKDVLKTAGKGGNKAALLLLNGPNTDSGKMTRPAAFDGISEFTVNNELLHPVMSECRVIKTDLELEALRYVTKMSSDAHMVVMRAIKPGMKEYQCESTFLNHCYYYGGCRHVCYTCIAGAGHSGSVLHYGHAGAPNDQPCEDGDIVLFDMGAEYYRFCSDITCSYPVNGKFSDKQKIVYNAVLRANYAVRDKARPGVSWSDMHLLANREMLEDLKAGGLLRGRVDDMMKANLAGRVFQPHGLGHFIGLDVHDVGGYLAGHPERAKEHGLRSLRTARVLKANMCVTIEPGCYFIDNLLDAGLKDPELKDFLVPERIEEFRGFGGVRIEDDVIIKKEGPVEVMSLVPRTVEEIEAWMAGKGGDEVDSVVKYKKENKM